MKILEFVKQYMEIDATKQDNFVKENIHFTDYIPFVMKDAYAKQIIKASIYNADSGRIEVKSSVKYHLFCRAIIDLYTDLQRTAENFLDEYDALKKSGALDLIMSYVNQEDLNEFKMIVDMAYNDALTNSYEMHAFISNELERASNVLGTFLQPVLNEIVEQLKTFDDEKIEKISKIVDAANKFKKK